MLRWLEAVLLSRKISQCEPHQRPALLKRLAANQHPATVNALVSYCDGTGDWETTKEIVDFLRGRNYQQTATSLKDVAHILVSCFERDIVPETKQQAARYLAELSEKTLLAILENAISTSNSIAVANLLVALIKEGRIGLEVERVLVEMLRSLEKEKSVSFLISCFESSPDLRIQKKVCELLLSLLDANDVTQIGSCLASRDAESESIQTSKETQFASDNELHKDILACCILSSSLYGYKSSTLERMLRELIKLDEDRAVDLLVSEFMTTDNWSERSSVVSVLISLNCKTAVEPFLECFIATSDKDTRRNAARVLANLGDERLVDRLIAHFENSLDEDVLCSTADVLAELEDERAVKPLLHALDKYGAGGNWARALGKLGAKEALPTIRKCIDEIVSKGCSESHGLTEALLALGDEESLLKWLAPSSSEEKNANVRRLIYGCEQVGQAKVYDTTGRLRVFCRVPFTKENYDRYSTILDHLKEAAVNAMASVEDKRVITDLRAAIEGGELAAQGRHFGSDVKGHQAQLTALRALLQFDGQTDYVVDALIDIIESNDEGFRSILGAYQGVLEFVADLAPSRALLWIVEHLTAEPNASRDDLGDNEILVNLLDGLMSSDLSNVEKPLLEAIATLPSSVICLTTTYEDPPPGYLVSLTTDHSADRSLVPWKQQATKELARRGRQSSSGGGTG